MIDDEQRPRYWRWTVLMALTVLGVVLALAFVLPLFAAELNDVMMLAFPLGFYLAAQGSTILLVVTVYWFAGRQQETDHKFGASEDL